jgi:hypothetical protein
MGITLCEMTINGGPAFLNVVLIGHNEVRHRCVPIIYSPDVHPALVLRLFALKTLANLHHFFNCALSFSVYRRLAVCLLLR